MGRSANRAARLVALIWIAFIARGTFYATILPLWEGFDEYSHFAFVHHLKTFGILPSPDERESAEINRSLRIVPLPWSLNNWSLPAVTHDAYWRLTPEERSDREKALNGLAADLQNVREGDAIYEAKQPPLYYVLCALVLKTVSTWSLPARVLALRLFSVVIASLVLPLAFAISFRVWGETQALWVTLLIASMPGLLIAVARVGNDCLAVVLFAVLAFAFTRPEPWDARGTLLVGATLGAGLLTKGYFVAAIPAVLLSALVALWRTPPPERARLLIRISGAMVLAVALSGWWYLRTLGGDSQAWVDAAPLKPVTLGELWRYAATMKWGAAIGVVLNGHFWVGGWSFLAVRSWMYMVFKWIFLLALPAGCLWILKSRPHLASLCVLYAGFWVALMYHAFVNFINSGIPASTGWYLYAVVACEAVLLCSGSQWLGRYQGYAMVSLIGLFLMLEGYATHFVLIPYYIGLITHRPDTSLTSFHVSQATDLGWREILSRLEINKAPFEVSTLGLLWIAFCVASVYLMVLAWRFRRLGK